jgi:hypothetical protein
MTRIRAIPREAKTADGNLTLLHMVKTNNGDNSRARLQDKDSGTAYAATKMAVKRHLSPPAS